MAGLRLIGVEKVYDKGVRILQGIDLDVADGEFLVLVGPSGCGKSTLLRCIAGLEDVSAGALYIGEREVTRLPPKDRDAAMVFQSYALYPHLTVRENMAFSLAIRKKPKAEIERAVSEAAVLLGLDKLLDRLPKQLSGGQRQRVAIGRAIVRRPQVFLFDEPLSNLDANLRAQMRVELKKLHQRLGVTMIYVTHDQVEAMTLADRICVLEGGYARQTDPPLALYEQPNSKFVAEFIGSPPMNFLRARVEGGRFVAEGLSIPLPENHPASSIPGVVDLGIRPHEFVFGDALAGRLEAVLDVAETVGWDVHLHARVGAVPVTVQTEAKRAASLAPGARFTLGVDPQRIKLFDPETTNAIRPEPSR
ncbi:MAG: sn-glycerol-3-phosphate ABC transporter ATP-binding protein UgpC [Myxococcales bacterium]|nr:MAG: sn-glycerol-3-phosphate ABC transporter ATP-binding protein UgpC [Myxococcales bacterium]